MGTMEDLAYLEGSLGVRQARQDSISDNTSIHHKSVEAPTNAQTALRKDNRYACL